MVSVLLHCYTRAFSSSSANLDAPNGLIRSKESKSKEVKMGKDEQSLRKKLKITGQEKMLYTSKIMQDFKPEKNTLPVKKGDTVEIIKITDCPPGKWLSRDGSGKYGYVPVACLQVSKEIQALSTQHIFNAPAEQDLYTDIEVPPRDSGACADTFKALDNYCGNSDSQYDDVSGPSLNSTGGGKGKGLVQFFKKDKSKKDDQASSPVIPNLNRTTWHDGEEQHTYDLTDEHEREKEEKAPGWKSLLFHKNKEHKVSERKFFAPSTGVSKFAKEEKIFREKFKYVGEINVLNIATVNDLAPVSPKDKLDLAVKPGETVEVIDVTNEDQIICRNFAGKYGYLRIDCLNFKIQAYE
ncbi:FYN-binding protein 2 [Anomaloglossus baeobatrachus]|uniref:FYN-binding protein 2 n=1 Tax=Anomaloglossus baeobatrachus TaxID=238106 RepID=UPI003F507B02